MKVKICGLYRNEDIEYINTYHPDYCGFIINFPKSHRNITIDRLKQLSPMVDPSIKRVGVFVNEDVDVVISLLKENWIDMAQLHGQEDDAYIQTIKREVNKPVLKFFKIQTKDDIQKAISSRADYILLDNGTGTGQAFDWRMLENIPRDYFLAGGINLQNVKQAMQYHPYALDISSGVETDKKKDANKIKEIIERIRKETI